MSTRTQFDEQLISLKEKLLEMVYQSKHAIDQSIIALQSQDLELAQKIIYDDKEINELEKEINDMVIKNIVKQQPVASDLRRLMVAVKISSDIERVGDLAVNIAKSTLFIGKQPFYTSTEAIPEMAKVVQQMLSDSLTAYHEEDIQNAYEIAAKDDVVDRLYGETIQKLLNLMAVRPEAVPQLTQLAFICRYLERVGDHVTNIAENIIYLVKGERVDLNFQN
ncbi:phosphate signaling complex protein PhoU [Bacillus pinisoli]|uniref:phosphate signaling complex protein PhoU n=1 Tax=Bacillus pinisoli TaxID=2901866 RepID=UPI001FF64379|nr:phosphate signaling complex protein PhoU [Bacillus pinisoli]